MLTEPTAGNTGIALAALANAQGMPIELALPMEHLKKKKPCCVSSAPNCGSRR